MFPVRYRMELREMQNVVTWSYLELKKPGDMSVFKRHEKAKLSIALSRDNKERQQKTISSEFFNFLENQSVELETFQVVTFNPISISDIILAPTGYPNNYALLILNMCGEPTAAINQGRSYCTSWHDLLGLNQYDGELQTRIFVSFGEFELKDENNVPVRTDFKPKQTIFAQFSNR